VLRAFEIMRTPWRFTEIKILAVVVKTKNIATPPNFPASGVMFSKIGVATMQPMNTAKLVNT
jgi:hypothetical protein